jgi:hypothetical protein
MQIFIPLTLDLQGQLAYTPAHPKRVLIPEMKRYQRGAVNPEIDDLKNYPVSLLYELTI